MKTFGLRTFNEIYESLPGNGWLLESEARLLYKHLSLLGPNASILEVGCYEGRSTVLLASAGVPVYCVDPFKGFDGKDPTGDKINRTWWDNIKGRGIYNVALYCCKIEDWQIPPHLITFAYLDGDHTYKGTIAQIEKALAVRAEIICIHDVNDTGGGVEVKKAALELLGPWQERVDRLAVWSNKNLDEILERLIGAK